MPKLLEKAKDWRRQKLLVIFCESGARLLFWGIIIVSGFLWLDEVFLLSQPLRFGILFCLFLSFLVSSYLFFFRPWQKCSWGDVLDAVGRVYPQARCYLRSAWELHHGRLDSHTSSQLAHEHLEETRKILETLPHEPAFVWRPSSYLKRLLWAGVPALVSWFWLGQSSWERLFLPWQDISLERFIRIEPGDAQLDWGKPVLISARCLKLAGGPRQAQETVLWVKTAGSWRKLSWDRLLDEAAVFNLASLTEPLRYQLTWRGLKSRDYELKPVPVPRLESLRAKIAGKPESVMLNSAEPLKVRRNSWVTIYGKPNEEILKAWMKISFSPAPLALQCSPLGDCEVSFAAHEDANFQFELQTADNRKEDSPAVYSLKALPDEPPQVELLSPQASVQASASSVLPVAYSAQDDSGLTRAVFLVRLPGGPEKEIPLRVFNPGEMRYIGDYPWDLAGLPVGARVEFRVKVYDDASPAQSHVSQPGTVEIVDFEANHRAMEERWSKTQGLLNRLAGREEKIRDLWASERQQEGREALEGLPEAWKEAVSSLSELAQSMNQDAYSNPGLREQFNDSAENLERVQKEDLPEAMKSSRQGNSALARKQHANLAAQLRRQEKILEQGRSLQGLQDFYNHASRMSQEGAQLEASLASLAKQEKGKPVAPELMNRLNSSLKRLKERMETLQKAIDALPRSQPGGGEEKAKRGYSLPLLNAQTSADALQQALRSGDFSSALSGS